MSADTTVIIIIRYLTENLGNAMTIGSFTIESVQVSDSVVYCMPV